VPHLREQLSEVEQGLKNLVDAIQQGMFARATKERLDALEAEKEKLEFSLLQEEIRHPVLTEEKIRFWLLAFRSLDLTLLEHRKRLVDSFVNSIHLYDDRIVVTFNYKDGAKTIMLADIPDDFGSDLDNCFPPGETRNLSGIAGFSFVHSADAWAVFKWAIFFSVFSPAQFTRAVNCGMMVSYHGKKGKRAIL